MKNKVRIIAFYLPQYHPFKENDEWWGKGFTEWTNVVKAKPLFRGHYQPKIPTDLGFYDLRVPEVREEQARMARDAGIEGFCYWHYWFEGHELMERPFWEVVNSGKPDFPFCIGWANETWKSKMWNKDGSLAAGTKILIEQTYSEEDDIVHFKNLIDEPNGIRIQSGRSPKVSGIMKQPQLSDSLLNKRKNLTMDTFVLWDKLVSKATYLRAINFLGESRFKTYICGPEDQLLTFAIFNVGKSYTGLDHIGYLHRPNINSFTHKQSDISDGKFVNPRNSNCSILSRITVCKFIFELCQDTPKGKAVAARILQKRLFPQGNIKIKKAIAISDHLDKFKELIKMFLDCKYVSKNDKKYIKKYLDDVLKLVPKKGKK